MPAASAWHRGEPLIVMENVPAKICNECGEN
ncbi:MAG: YgiT-type zinc finger protein [bacterium]